MLKLDLKGFIRALETAPEQENRDEPLFGEGYLTECIALPFLCGENISLHDIDWDAFDLEDARAMYYRCEDADKLEAPVRLLYAPAVSVRPAADRTVRFV